MHVLASKQTLNKADIWIIFFLHNSLRNHLYKFSIICTKSGHRRTWTHSCRKIPLCNTTTARSAPIVQWNHSIAEQCKHHCIRQYRGGDNGHIVMRPIGFTKHRSMSDTVHACIQVHCLSHRLIPERSLDKSHHGKLNTTATKQLSIYSLGP